MDHSKHTQHPPGHGQSLFPTSNILTGLAIGGAASLILAPHLLPALGIGHAALAEESMWVLHTSAEAGGSGLAGVLNHALAAVPLIGEKLAAGGAFNAAATASIGIGGMLLGKFISRNKEGKASLKWGKIIQYAALITSALIALPTVLTALSAGLIYLSTLANDVGFSNSVISLVDKTLGTMGGSGNTLMGFSGLAAALPHFLTCGVALLPMALSYTVSDNVSISADRQSKYTDGSVTAEIITDRKLEEGKLVNARLVLKHRDGSPVSADELAVVHTEKLHLFVTDSSLKDYHHLHPQPNGEPGTLAFSFTPKTANNYIAWADFTMIKNGQNHKLHIPLPSSSGRSLAPSVRVNSFVEKNGLGFDWQSQPLQRDTATIVTVNVTDMRGNPITDLEPVMGAYAHLVGFSADGTSMILTHPLDKEPQNDTDRGGPVLRFHVEPDCTGATQFYLQVRRGGNDIYVPFGQQIKPPALAAARIVSSHAAMGHAM